ncbi:MAG: hypothetical protein ACI9Y1_000116 [Lentisphaeria bacterium]
MARTHLVRGVPPIKRMTSFGALQLIFKSDRLEIKLDEWNRQA